MSAWATKLSVVRLIGWYDKQDTNANGANPDVSNEVAALFDFINHGAIVLAYETLAWVIAICTWGYVYGQLTDQSLNN